MKIALSLIVVFIAAFVLGRWNPQLELRQKDREIDRLRQQVRNNSIGGIGQILSFESREEPKRRRHRRSQRDEPDLLSPPDRPAETNAIAQVATNGSPAEVEIAFGEDEENPRDRNMSEEIDAAIELWNTRSQIARDTFLSNIEADEAAAADFDASIELMNVQLGIAFASWAEFVADKGAVQSEDGARLMHAVTGSVVETYDRLGEKLPEGWNKKAGNNFKLFDFIDPRVGRPLTEIEGILDEGDGGFGF